MTPRPVATADRAFLTTTASRKRAATTMLPPLIMLFLSSPIRAAGGDSGESSEVGAFYWTALAPDIVNPGREEQGLVSA